MVKDMQPVRDLEFKISVMYIIITVDQLFKNQ